MNMPPRRASTLLHALGVDPSVIGDLEESAESGRTRSWYWRQALGVVLLGPAPPVAVGWAMLLGGIALFTMAAAGPLLVASLRTGQWTTLEIAVLFGGYCSLGLVAWMITRVCRQAPALIVGATRVALFTLLGMMVIQLLRAAAVYAELL